MNLFKLKEKQEDLKCDIKYYKNEKDRLERKVDVKATQYDKEIVSNGSGNTREEALLELAQIELDLDDAINKLNNITSLVNDKYDNYKKHNDYDKQIYVEKRLFKWSNSKISNKHNGISKSQIYNIVNKFEEVEKSGK